MIRDIQAKVLLSTVSQPDPWFGLRYNMNLYRGCQHQCIYCDSRSECYQIEDFSDILIKANALDILPRELAAKRERGTIGTGSMNDPYMPIEKSRLLMRGALEIICSHQFPVHILTKSDLVLRDTDLLERIGKIFAAVSFTVTTPDDELAGIIEPAASPPSRRLKAMRTLSSAGITTGIIMMPILPFLEDSEANITQIVLNAARYGAHYIVPSFGMTMRDRQRAYFFDKLDRHFPGVRRNYELAFGDQYSCSARDATRLKEVFEEMCRDHGIATRMPAYDTGRGNQQALF